MEINKDVVDVVVQGAREGWPRFVLVVLIGGWFGLVRGSVAKVHHSRRAGSSGDQRDDDLSVG